MVVSNPIGVLDLNVERLRKGAPPSSPSNGGVILVTIWYSSSPGGDEVRCFFSSSLTQFGGFGTLLSNVSGKRGLPFLKNRVCCSLLGGDEMLANSFWRFWNIVVEPLREECPPFVLHV